MANNLKELFVPNAGTDDKSIEILIQALEKNNLQGFDYIEYKLSVVALSRMNMDETTAIRSAFTTASTMGLTKEKLTETAIHYREILEKEKEQFNIALQNQQDQRIASKLQEISKFKEQVLRNEELIKKMQDEIAKAQAAIRDADFQIEEAKQKIETTKNNFMSTHQSFIAQINQDIDRINQSI
jgi:hypothetical protein